MPDEDTQVLLRCGSQVERRAILGLLFSRHRERLKRMVELRLDDRVRRRTDASDVVQEALFEATQRIEEFIEDPAVPFFIWLRYLTVQRLQQTHRHHLGRQARDVRRELSIERRSAPAVSSLALAAQLLGRETSPSEAAVRAEQRQRLEEALSGMDPLDRELIALRHFEQLSGREAAQILGIKEPAARQRYIRALRKLKDTLAQMPGGLE